MEDCAFLGTLGIIFLVFICAFIGYVHGQASQIDIIRNSCENYGKYVIENTTMTCKETK